MAPVTIADADKADITAKIQTYFREELEQDIGSFEAQFVLDFFADQVGPYFYNQGLYDAQAILMKRLDSVTDAISDIEKPIR